MRLSPNSGNGISISEAFRSITCEISARVLSCARELTRALWERTPEWDGACVGRTSGGRGTIQQDVAQVAASAHTEASHHSRAISLSNPEDCTSCTFRYGLFRVQNPWNQRRLPLGKVHCARHQQCAESFIDEAHQSERSLTLLSDHVECAIRRCTHGPADIFCIWSPECCCQHVERTDMPARCDIG